MRNRQDIKDDLFKEINCETKVVLIQNQGECKKN